MQGIERVNPSPVMPPVMPPTTDQVPEVEPETQQNNVSKEETQVTPDAAEMPDSREMEEVVTYMVIPPDGGWGWVIVTASFFCNLIVDGIIFSFGMFLNDMVVAFDESKSRVAIVGSLLTGFYLMAGPFVSALANRYGFRLVTIFGAVLGTVGFILSVYATNINFLYFTYGVLGGIGFGLVYVPAVITTGFYFERWRALATGIAVCGSGIGTFVMAPLNTMLIEAFGWRGALLIQAGLVLNCAVFGALFRPLKPTRVITTRERDVKSSTDQLPLLYRIKMERENQMKQCESAVSLADNGSITAEKSTAPRNRLFMADNNNTYPTAATVLNSSSSTAMQSSSMANIAIGTSNNYIGPLAKQKRLSVPAYPDGEITLRKLEDDPKALTSANPENNTSMKNVPAFVETLKPVLEECRPTDDAEADENDSNAAKMALIQQGARSNSRRTRTASECSIRSMRSRRGTKDSGVRPFYRDDIFFSASLLKLPQYTSQMSSVGYHMSVTRLPTKHDVLEEEANECMLCPESVRRTLATMLDVSLLRSPTFLLLSVSGFITMMGFYVPFMYLADRALMSGMDPVTAVWLVSNIGITNTIGRVLCGLVSSFPGIDALLINNVALTVGGIATILSGISTSDAYQFTYSAVFGLAMACFASLRSILIVDLLGLDRLTNAFGLLLLFQGVAATIGAPVAGAFMDATGSYDASFYLSGSLILLSAILCYPLNKVNRWELQKTETKKSAVV